MRTLAPGEYLGTPLLHRSIAGLGMTVTAYPPRRSYARHVHALPTLFVLLADEHLDEVGRAAFRQTPLSVVFHPVTEPHATATGPKGLVGINLELSDEWLERCQVRPRELCVEHRLLDSLEARLLGAKLAAAAHPSPRADADADSAVLELVSDLVRAPRREPRTPHWLARAKEFLAANARGPLRLGDVAAEVGVHPVYCARAFRRATGCSVSRYVHQLRLVEAGARILDGGRPLAEAALAAGFADQAHFTRTCSRVLGFTPGRLGRLRRAVGG